MKWASASSTDSSTTSAVDACTRDLRNQMGGADVDLLLVFVSNEHRARFPMVPTLLRPRFPGAVILGCSAQGIVGGGRELEHTCAISLVAANLPDATLTVFRSETTALPDADAPPQAWHSQLRLAPIDGPRYFIVLADPFSTNIEGITTGLDYAYPGSLAIGGLASAARRPGQNVLYLNDDVYDRGVVGVSLHGNIAVDTLVAQGCRPIGKPAKITGCHGTLISALDGKPALVYLQELADELPAQDRQLMQTSLFVGFHMNPVESGDPQHHYLIRNLTGVDAGSGSIAVGEVPTPGQIIQFHLRDKHASAADLEQHLRRFQQEQTRHEYQGALLFTCLGRGKHLYGTANHDTAMFAAHLGDIPVGGFFCNGEIGPVAGATYVHGYTSSFGLFRSIQGESS